MGTKTAIKSRFRTKSEHSLDTKGRLNFPSRFRDVLAQYGSETLILVAWKKHLRAYPVSEWEVLEDQLVKRGKEQPQLIDFIRFVLSGVTECNLDKQGRILIPAALRNEAHMEKEVVVTGMLEFVEIWDKEAWQVKQQTTRDNAESFNEALVGIL